MKNHNGNENTLEDFHVSEMICKKTVTSQELIENNGNLQFREIVYEKGQKRIIEYYYYDAFGRLMPLDSICGISWSGQFVPQDCLGYCLNPFSLHPARMIFVGFDGQVTPLGNILCLDCLAKQENHIRFNSWSFGLLRKEVF